MLPDFLAPILPRLSLIAFRYSQPIFISTAIRYLNAPLEDKSSNKGYAVILMAVVIYLGLAVRRRNFSRLEIITDLLTCHPLRYQRACISIA